MAKPMLVTLPFVLLLLDYWPLRRFQVGQSADAPEAPVQAPIKSWQPMSAVLSLIWEKIPLFALAAVSSVVTFLAQKSAGAVVHLETWPIKIRIANGLVSYVKYMGKMIWPHPLAVLYPHPGDSLPIWKAAGAGVLLLCISILVVRGARRYPYLVVGWLWYLGTLVPVIGFVQVGVQAMADRFTYIPLIGLYIIIAWGVPEIVPRWPHRKLYLATLSTTPLFEHTLEITPNNWLSNNNLGVALYSKGRTDDAIKHYLEALRIKPDYVETHNNLGNALYSKGRTDDAIKHYLEALRLKPDYFEAHNNLGNALYSKGRTDDAIKHYLEALRIEPDYVEAHMNLGNTLYSKGRTDDAIKHYLEALRLKPDYVEAHNSLGVAFARKGNVDMALKHFQKALQINPNFSYARDNLKKALLFQERNQ
jgi:Flp pilus assembly protein TadD